MYNSLKSWMDLDAIRKPFKNRTSSGLKMFYPDENIKVYAEGKTQIVTNALGKEVVSSMMLYVDGDTEINVMDTVTFEDRTSDILSIDKYYRAGKCDIKVVYL